jgi:tetratricopeptide (TPR) repeat protein
VAEVDNHVTQQDQRLTRSVQTLQQLAARYTPAAVAVAATSPDQARERLEFARGGVSEARRALATDDSGKAAVFLQAAESAADQAESLLDGIEHLEAELTQAASGLQAALREIDTDIAEGTALLASLPGDRSALVARAQDTASAVRAEMAAGQPFDALGALRALEQADAALDQALSGVREERERQERARAVLDQAMLVARSSMTAAGDFITTRRGGVGAEARTRLAEAQRHFQQAIAAARGDPEAALAEAQHADALAQQARSLAERDVEHFTYAEPGRVVRTGGLGGFGGGLGGAVLGGILIDSMLGGGRRGWGGAGWGGGGGLGLGSFGGAGTRARHSIGGMF